MLVETARWTNPDDRNDVINLPKDGPAPAIWLWIQVNKHEGKGQDRATYVAELRAKFAALPPEQAELLKPYLEIALTWQAPPESDTFGRRTEWALAQAIYAKYRELVPPPAPLHHAWEREDACRHNVAFSADCPECEAEFA